MSARNVGVKVGRGVGIVGATLWKGSCLIANGLGDAGEGFMEGAESGWEDRCKAMDLADAQRKVARLQKAQEIAARMEAERAAPVATVAA